MTRCNDALTRTAANVTPPDLLAVSAAAPAPLTLRFYAHSIVQCARGQSL